MASPTRHGPRGRAFFHFAQIVAPLLLLASVYLAAFLFLAFVHTPQKLASLLSIAFATAVTVLTYEGGRWRLGFFVPPRIALRDLAGGMALATLLVLIADAFIVMTTSVRHGRGNGFPWSELALVFIPAVLHEELLFRGYAYQKLRAESHALAVSLTSIVFAALHGNNAGMTAMAMANLLLAGVLLAFAYEATQRLWFPIGIHLAWNVVSGPILGYDVSGYVPAASVLTVRGGGAGWVSGGTFGIEGSVWAVVVEVAGIVWLLFRMNSERRTQNEELRR